MYNHEPLMKPAEAWEELYQSLRKIHDAHRALAALVDRDRGVDAGVPIEVPVIRHFVSVLDREMADIFDHVSLVEPTR